MPKSAVDLMMEIAGAHKTSFDEFHKAIESGLSSFTGPHKHQINGHSSLISRHLRAAKSAVNELHAVLNTSLPKISELSGSHAYNASAGTPPGQRVPPNVRLAGSLPQEGLVTHGKSANSQRLNKNCQGNPHWGLNAGVPIPSDFRSKP